MLTNKNSNNFRVLTALAFGLALTLSFSACAGGSADKADKKGASPSANDLMPVADASATEGWASDGEAGISWVAPASWEVGEERPMRAATYYVAPVGEDGARAECRVNFFGADQGGDVASNIARWVGQMEVDGQEGVNPEPRVAETTQDGIALSILELQGTYLERMSPMAQSSTAQVGYMMFAVIAQGPNGSVFFKMTGPAATMETCREDFRRMIGSIATQSH